MKRQVWLTTLIGMLAVACGDDVTATTDTDTDTEGTSTGDDTSDPTTDPGTTSTGPDPDTTNTETDSDTDMTETDTDDPSETDTDDSDTDDTDDTKTGEPVDFVITIENISDQGPLPTPFSPGVWMEQDSSPVFALNAEASEGMALLAEDGNPTTLATEIEGLGTVLQSGVFDTPIDGGAEGEPIMPGQSYEIAFTAQPGSRLGLASMMVGTNDVVWATGPQGLSLFQGNGDPISRDIAGDLNLFDAGSEANQPPSGGIYQPPGMLGENVGPSEEGVISERNESTRHIVAARRLMGVEVEMLLSEDGMTFLGYEVTFENITGDTGGTLTPLSPVAWATHSDAISLITPGGSAADLPGLEALAEDGDASGLIATLADLPEVDQAGTAGDANFGPGETVSFTVDPVEGQDVLSLGTMVVESNDAIIALEPQGVRLFTEDEDGNTVPRSPASIANDISALMEVWDVGTEANQTPGAGSDTAVNQENPNTGDADPDATIRYYFDPTNDLLDITSLVDVDVVLDTDGNGDVNVSVRVSNDSDATPFQFTMSAGVFAMTPEGVSLFTDGMAASAGLESLAEDGTPATLVTELEGVTTDDVLTSLATAPGGLGTFVDLLAVTSTDPVLHFAAMIVPSNDTFIATGPDGVDIFDDEGALLTADEIRLAILASLQVYDAGTEQNQAGATGRDMAPFQPGANTGADEGNGLLRIVTPGASGALSNEPVWEYPRMDQMLRVTVTPAR